MTSNAHQTSLTNTLTNRPTSKARLAAAKAKALKRIQSSPRGRMQSPYYDNDMDEPVWLYTSMSRSGAIQMAKTLIAKMGVTVLEQPMQRDDGLWVIMFTNPFMRIQ